MTHILKLWCPNCKQAILTSYNVATLSRDLDGPPCEICGTTTELDTTVPGEKVKTFTTKKKYRKNLDRTHDLALRVHKSDRLKQFKRLEDFSE